jgi:hypothetical protein
LDLADLCRTCAATRRFSSAQRVEATFGDQLQLRGYEFGEVELRPGDVLDLDLYWQALQPLDRDYSIFVHLTDGDQLLQAQQDSFPGAGNAPTLNWSTDVVLARCPPYRHPGDCTFAVAPQG